MHYVSLHTLVRVENFRLGQTLSGIDLLTYNKKVTSISHDCYIREYYKTWL